MTFWQWWCSCCKSGADLTAEDQATVMHATGCYDGKVKFAKTICLVTPPLYLTIKEKAIKDDILVQTLMPGITLKDFIKAHKGQMPKDTVNKLKDFLREEFLRAIEHLKGREIHFNDWTSGNVLLTSSYFFQGQVWNCPSWRSCYGLCEGCIQTFLEFGTISLVDFGKAEGEMIDRGIVENTYFDEGMVVEELLTKLDTCVCAKKGCLC